MVQFDTTAAAAAADLWTINGPGLTGQGTLKIGYAVTGNASGTGIHSWQFLVFDPLTMGCCGATWVWNSPQSGVISIPFDFGTPNEVVLQLLVATEGDGLADFSARIPTLQVLDSSGNATTDFTLTTSSGYDPSSPPSAVPEPSSLLMLGTGLAGVAAAIRRKLNTA